MGEHQQQQHSWACIVRKQVPQSAQLMEALSHVGYRTRGASNCAPDVIASRAGRSAVAFLCSNSDPGVVDADFSSRLQSTSSSFRQGYVLVPYAFAPARESIRIACWLPPNMTVIVCASAGAFAGTIIELLVGAGCPAVAQALQQEASILCHGGPGCMQAERLAHVTSVTPMADALLLTIPDAGISGSQARAVSSLGPTIAHVAHCVDLEGLSSCTGMAADSAEAVVCLFEGGRVA